MSNPNKQVLAGVCLSVVAVAVFVLSNHILHNPTEALVLSAVCGVGFAALLFPVIKYWESQTKRKVTETNWLEELSGLKKRLNTLPKTTEVKSLLSTTVMLEQCIEQEQKQGILIPTVVFTDTLPLFHSFAEIYLTLKTTPATLKSAEELEKFSVLLPQFQNRVAVQLSRESREQLASSYTVNDRVLEEVEHLVRQREEA